MAVKFPRGRSSLVWVCCVWTLLISTDAFAIGFDFDGRGILDAQVSLGFEDEVPDIVSITRTGVTGPDVVDVEGGLEGRRALKVGGVTRQSLIPLADPQFDGERVEVKLWVLPQGTDVDIALRWIAGDPDRYVREFDYLAGYNVGYTIFTPTGRATSDGWVEYTSGPVDWQVGGATGVSFLNIFDVQHNPSRYTNDYPVDVESFALIDAIEIEQLGPAKQIGDACSLVTESDVCGDDVCLFGRCTDAAHVYSHPGFGQIRHDYVSRRLNEINIFTSVRMGRANIGEVASRLLALDTATTKTFWSEMIAAYELLHDGHGGPATMAPTELYSNLGICLGPGEGDLLPDSLQEGTVQPIVFKTTHEQLQVGDMITAIDGQSVADWMQLAARYLYYNGDPNGRASLQTNEVLKAAAMTGASVTFSRCIRDPLDPQAMTPCAEGEVETVTLDFADALGETLFNDVVPTDLYDFSMYCDLRFKPAVDISSDQNNLYYATGWRDVGDIRHVLFNGFPAPQQGGQQWRSDLQNALATAPEKVIVDERTGFGGTFEGVNFLTSQFLDPQNRATAELVPWVGEEMSPETLDPLRLCVANGGNGLGCGSYYLATPTAEDPSGGARDAAVALLLGRDVSGNDYFTRYLQFRNAPVRIFGYGPTMGAFGVSCVYPSHLSELYVASYQCHDTKFAADPLGDDAGYESGKGVQPDEWVFQKQSDALLGIDTIVTRAEMWLGGVQ